MNISSYRELVTYNYSTKRVDASQGLQSFKYNEWVEFCKFRKKEIILLLTYLDSDIIG